MTDGHAASVTLVGRTSSWQQRLPAGAADRGGTHGPITRGASALLVSWLHHPSYGTLGIYLPAEATSGDLALPRRRWVQLTGYLRPALVWALAGDPRSAIDVALTPLLIEVATISPARRGQQRQPLLDVPLYARVRPAAGVMRALWPLARWRDAVYWPAQPMSTPVSVAWNTVRGVVTQLYGQRYLRYVLSLRATRGRSAR
jgi:hypothetical protein